MIMGRRDFLKGLLAITGAVVAAPLLFDGSSMAASPSILDMAPIIELSKPMGRLGRVRIDQEWLPLNDAWFTMYRSHTPLHTRSDVILQDRKLIDSPWKVELYTAEPLAMSNLLFDGGLSDVPFEIVPHSHYRLATPPSLPSFFGRGSVSEYGTQMGDIDGGPIVYSFTIEGLSRLSRTRLPDDIENQAWWEEE